jgi:ABC-type hemin transport system substrate-binding protein
MRIVSQHLVALGLILTVGFVLGCGDEPSSEESIQTTETRDTPRLVTLAPALSQMLVDLGLSDAIVGVAEHDAAAPPGLPIVGHYAAVSTEMLLSTRPTHVLMMAGPGGPPARLKEMAGDGLFELHTFPFPLSLQDIGEVLYDETRVDEPGSSLGEALGVPEAAMALKMRMLHQFAAIRTLTAARDEPTVLMVIGTGPIMALGPGTVHDELLGFAGGLNAAAEATVTAPEFGRESLLTMAPQVVIFLQPDAPELTDNDPRLAAFAGLPIPAIESGRVHVINDPLVLLPSTSIGRIGAEMAKAIHPELADEIDQVTALWDGADHE